MNLSDFGVVSDKQSELDNIKLESEYYTAICYDETDRMTFTKAKKSVWFVLRGENIWYCSNTWLEKLAEVGCAIGDEFKVGKFNPDTFKGELETMIADVKDNMDWNSKLINKGIVFDGRYLRKFAYENKELLLLEQAWLEDEGVVKLER
jgi:hypothetical protein